MTVQELDQAVNLFFFIFIFNFIKVSVSSNNSSNGESDNHFFIQNKSRDYRVISLDEKPCPGRLDDFVPEVERRNEEINRKIVEEKEISKG